MKKNIYLQKRGKKKANIAAVILIVLLLMVSVGVLVYNPFIEEEVHVDYGRIFTETRSGVERAQYEAFQMNMRLGLLEYDGVWYYNAPYELSQSRIEDEIRKSVLEALQSIEYEDEQVEVSLRELEDKVEILLLDEGLKIIVDGVEVDVKANGEERIIEINEEFLIPSDLKNTIEKVNTWLECDAGRLTDLFKEYNENLECQFENCCCGKDPLPQSEIDRVVDEYGIKREDVMNILSLSMESLNHLLSGADECDERLPEEQLRSDMHCFIAGERSVIEYGTDYILELHQNELCARPTEDCGLREIIGSRGIGELSDWDNPPSIEFTGVEGEPIFPSSLSPDLQKQVNQKLPDSDDTRTYLYKVGLERKAAGDVTVICRNPDVSATDYNELRFRLQFKNKYSCDAPAPRGSDWHSGSIIPLQCAAGSANIPNVCEGQNMVALPCRDDPRPHDDYCPITVVCGDESLLESDLYNPEDNTFACADYMENPDNEWIYPGFDERCDANNLCTTCGDRARCDTPANETAVCGEFGECGVMFCSGDGIGEEHCGLPFGRESLEASECAAELQCGVVCLEGGICSLPDNVQDIECEASFSGMRNCPIPDFCTAAGVCGASRPTNVGACCPDAAQADSLGFCPQDKRYCCEGFCSGTPCPVPT